MALSRSLGAAIAAAVVNIGFLHGAHAAEADPQAGSSAPVDDKVTELEGLTVLGSRRYDRSSDTETAVPVDVLPMQKAAEQGGNFDLAQTLQYTAPSFISGHQTGADNADSVDSAAL